MREMESLSTFLLMAFFLYHIPGLSAFSYKNRCGDMYGVHPDNLGSPPTYDSKYVMDLR